MSVEIRYPPSAILQNQIDVIARVVAESRGGSGRAGAGQFDTAVANRGLEAGDAVGERLLDRRPQRLGQEAEEQPCPAIEGIDKEGKSNLAMVEDDLKDHVILAGCSETEHHEISVYENLITHANAMGHDDIVALLVENLEQEQHTLGEVMKAALAQAQRAASTA